MKRKTFFGTVITIMLVLASLIFFSPLINLNDLIYPVRIDSLYVNFRQKEYLSQPGADTVKAIESFNYLPSHLGLPYRRVNVVGTDSIELKGWYVPAENPGPVLLILHDFNQSKISCLNDIKEFHERGFRVFVFDLRAHGESGGVEFTYGREEVPQIHQMLDTIVGITHESRISVLAKGVGADLAITAAGQDTRIKVLVLQSPYYSLKRYIERHSRRRWGKMTTIFGPMMKNQIRQMLEFDPDTMDFTAAVKKITCPVFYIAARNDEIIPADETYQLFLDSESSLNKDFWVVEKSGHLEIEENEADTYYNRIAVFIVRNLPRTGIKSRFRRLV